MSARRLVHLGLGAVLLLSVASCQKPSPGITVVTNGVAKHFQAQQWCGGRGTLVSGNECPGTGPTHDEIIRVRDGDLVGIDVDSDLTHPGWYLYDVDAKQNITGINTKHYFALPNVVFTGRPTAGLIRLEVRTVDHVPASATDVPKITGQWKFELIQQV
ncbi:MAG: hypothetical protein JWL79_1352 [Frankiales bacterium]|jgi:hypothetical protein|nr:hypothetical protein [Frankiales bacterium]